MIDVTTNWWMALAVAGGVGLLGGLVNELISSHTEAELRLGRVELRGGQGLYDLGFWASMIVGMVTAVAFLLALRAATTGGKDPG